MWLAHYRPLHSDLQHATYFAHIYLHEFPLISFSEGPKGKILLVFSGSEVCLYV